MGKKLKRKELQKNSPIGQKRREIIRAIERCTSAPNNSKIDNMLKKTIKSAFIIIKEVIVSLVPSGR